MHYLLHLIRKFLFIIPNLIIILSYNHGRNLNASLYLHRQNNDLLVKFFRQSNYQNLFIYYNFKNISNLNKMNIHGFNNQRPDVNRRARPAENNGSSGFFGGDDSFQSITVQHLRNVEKHKVLFLSGRRKVKNPREQNYLDMLIEMCCPVFKCLSFTTFMLIVYIAIFIAEAVIGLRKEGQLLQINGDKLTMMGANSPILIRKAQVWRLITAAVLHVNFMHFFGNFTSTIILLSRFQYTFGTVRCIVIYIISAISGNIFSALCAPNGIKAGASTCLYGLLGVMVGYLIINWTGLNKIGPILKCQLTCVVMMLIVFTILFTSVGPNNIDYFGHLGGFLAGLWLSGINPTIDNENCERNFRVIAIVILIIQLTICFVLFYLLDSLFTASQLK